MTANNQRRSVSTQPGAPALVEFKNFKFLIVNKPNQASLPAFIKVNVSSSVRVCVCVCVCVCVGWQLLSVKINITPAADF